jgi:hypothetical protein
VRLPEGRIHEPVGHIVSDTLERKGTLFPSVLRWAGSGFAFSLGRVFGAAGPALIGALAATTGSYPLAISLLSLIYIVGLPFIAMAPETANQPLAK